MLRSTGLQDWEPRNKKRVSTNTSQQIICGHPHSPTTHSPRAIIPNDVHLGDVGDNILESSGSPPDATRQPLVAPENEYSQNLPFPHFTSYAERGPG